MAAFPTRKSTARTTSAAEHFNRCRARGIEGSNTDFLLCAVAGRHRMPIFTIDADFTRFARVVPVALYTA
jgi:predicted nucleic acid-binding protein